MASTHLNSHLFVASQKLDIALDKTIKSEGHSRDVKKMKLLLELIKEQIKNENTLSSARSPR